MKEEKVDKGFEFVYYNLSYRRRFIRTLWLIPVECLVLVLIGNVFEFKVILILAIIALLVGAFIQATYNYKKWKEESSSE